jgi:hypothetical protein
MLFLVARNSGRPFAEQQFVGIKASHDLRTRGGRSNFIG